MSGQLLAAGTDEAVPAFFWRLGTVVTPKDQQKRKSAIITISRQVLLFLRRDLWLLDIAGLNHMRRLVIKVLQVLYLVGEGAIRDKLLIRASALTYWTLLSIVPLLAFTFSILKGLGVQRRLETVLLQRLTVGSQEIASQIIAYIDRVNINSLGAIGLAVLMVVVFSMLNNIEVTFNDIWGLKKNRPTIRQISDYFSFLIILPIVFFIAISLTASFKSNAIMTWLTGQPELGRMVIASLKVLPFVMLSIFFSFLYLFMPNTKVKFWPALTAGIFAGTAWQLAQWGYVTLQIGMTRYNILYGTFAQIPFMLIWIYFSWVIVLFGAEFSFALQNVSIYKREQESARVNLESRFELALAFLKDIDQAYNAAGPRWRDVTLADQHQVSIRLARAVLSWVSDAGLIVLLGHEQHEQIMPAVNLGELPVAGILEKLEQTGGGLVNHQPQTEAVANQVKVRVLMERLKQVRRQTLEELKLRDL